MDRVVSPEQVWAVAGELRGLLGGLDPGWVTRREAPEIWDPLEEIRRLATGYQMLLAKRVDESDAPATAGLGNGAEWIAQRSGGSLRSAYDTVIASKRLETLSEVTRALRQGRISTVQAVLIADACAVDPAAEQGLLDLAGKVSVGELRRECLGVKAAADPDPEKTRDRIHRERSLRWFLDQEGAWCLHGRGPAEAGVELATVLAPIIEDIFAAAREAGLREPREAYTWDALLEMARMAWAYMHGLSIHDTQHDDETTPDPGTNEPDDTPTDIDTLGDLCEAAGLVDPQGRDSTPVEETADTASTGGGPGGPHGEPVVVGAPRKRRRRTVGVNPWARAVIRVDHSALVRGHVEGDEICDVAGVGPISVAAARELLGDAIVHLIITKGQDANITYLGRGQNAVQRIASLFNQPECQRLGCNRQVMEWDHRRPYAQTRVTKTSDMQGLCKQDHWLKTRYGWELVDGVGKRPMVPPDHPRHPNNTRRPRDKPGAA